MFRKVRTKKPNLPKGSVKPDLPGGGFVALSVSALRGPEETVAFRFVQ